ncbi:MAG: sulfurtransferase TusA family protein [Candidatus Omnitrophota bacterium]
MKGYNLPSNLDDEISELEKLIDRHKKGEVSKVELKAHRVPFGVYEQREPETYMIRIRCAAGIITPAQLEGIAALSLRYGSGQIHLTTRQELQIHYVKLDDIVNVIRGLRELKLASRGGGGNTVRNITCQEDAGIEKRELFDVSPYAVALTSRLISEDDSWTLPRKFKIAFSGSADDKGYATVADLGFIASIQEAKIGFKVYAAGGLGTKPREASLIFDFIPAENTYLVAKAIKTLFWKFGNRKNKHRARLRFLWQSLGEEEFKKRIKAEYEALQRQSPLPLEVEDIDNTGVAPDIKKEEAMEKNDFEVWKMRFVREQKQKGLFVITLPVRLGFIDSEKTKKLAGYLRSFSDNTIRLTKDQNFLIRNIKFDYLDNFYNFLRGTMDNFNQPPIIDKIISCAGASTCQLGICLSRGLAQAIINELEESKLDLDKLSHLKINISGCPNACGQHLLGDLGFFGKAARKDGRLYPAYNIVAGALIYDNKTELAQIAGESSARDLPKLVKDFLTLYLSKSGTYKNFREYFQKEGKTDLSKLCAKYAKISTFEEDKNYYFDWGSDKAFSLAERGSGECSAGLLDLIESDFKKIEEKSRKFSESPEEKLIGELVFYASRVLLITRAIEVKSENETYENFIKNFIDTGLIAEDFRKLIQAAQNKNYKFLLEKREEIFRLIKDVKSLYENMDSSFNFKALDKTQSEPAVAVIVRDLRGVACPMNFVKSKMELSKLNSGDILEILLDDGAPIENVPNSLKEEGHKILKQEQIGNYWKVLVEKI